MSGKQLLAELKRLGFELDRMELIKPILHNEELQREADRLWDMYLIHCAFLEAMCDWFMDENPRLGGGKE